MEEYNRIDSNKLNSNSFNEEKEIYKIFEFFDYLLIEPKKGKHDYTIFFFSGFNENAGKYLYIFKFFFENFSKVYDIKFKIYLPMLNIYKREEYPNSLMISYEDDRHSKLYSWFNYKLETNKRVDFIPNIKKDNLIKKLIEKEKQILKESENIIFIGFSMGGRYLIHILESLNLKTKFNLFFKSRVFYYKSKKLREKIMNEQKDNIQDFYENKFFAIYSKNDKFCILKDAISTYFLLNEEFKSVEVKIDNGYKHIVDYNCIEYLKNILLKELKINKKACF